MNGVVCEHAIHIVGQLWTYTTLQKLVQWYYGALNVIFLTIFAQRCIQNVLKTTHFSSESPSNKSKSINSHTICMQRCAKIVKNITFNVTQYYQISFCSVVEVQSHPARCIACSQTTPLILNCHKRAEMVKFHVLLLFEQVSVVIQQKLHVKTTVKHEISPSSHVCDNLK